jgi:hypothetical protein
MFSSINLRKVVRISATSATAGAVVALVLLGGPADAATVAGHVGKMGRGY